MVLALGETPINDWATSPTFWVLVPATNIPVASFGNVGFIATIAFKRLCMKWAFPISRNFDLLQPTSGGHQITGIGAIAIPFAFGTTLSPGCSNELV